MMFKKVYLTVCLLTISLSLLISPASASINLDANDDAIFTNMDTLTIRNAVSTYFSQREAFLQGTSSTISIAVSPIVFDEQNHLDALLARNIVLLSSYIEIDDILCWDNIAEVSLTENATYQINNTIHVVSVPHDIHVYLNKNNRLEISSDSYFDTIADFSSCSYIPPTTANIASSFSGGSGLCIINIAQQEVGVAEDSTGNTKYSDWMNMPRQPWCAMFVSWCADQANIETSVIHQSASVNTIKDYLVSQGRYYASASQGGNFIPQPGDLFFQLDSYDDPGHIGIVVSVDGNYIWVIDGNWGDQVCYRQMPLSQSNLVAFGRPNYSSTDHQYPLIWNANASSHWKECINCDHTISHPHILVQQNAFSPYICTVCGHQTSVGVNPLTVLPPEARE